MSCVVGGMGGEGPVSGTPEPSSSLLLKQLSMMRRFSPSKRSARLMPGLADMVASPSVRNLGRALGPVGGVSGCFGRRRTAGRLADGGYSRRAGQRDAQNDVAGPGLRLCFGYGMRPCRPGELGTLGSQMPSTLVPQYVPLPVRVCLDSGRRAPASACAAPRYTFFGGARSELNRGRGGNNPKDDGIPPFLAPNNLNFFLLHRPSRLTRKTLESNTT
jgi:hypothetical protein